MQTPSPDAHGIAVIILVVVALYLFTRDRLPLESSSLAVIIALTVGFQLFPYESDGIQIAPADFLVGFGNQAWCFGGLLLRLVHLAQEFEGVFLGILDDLHSFRQVCS